MFSLPRQARPSFLFPWDSSHRVWLRAQATGLSVTAAMVGLGLWFNVREIRLKLLREVTAGSLKLILFVQTSCSVIKVVGNIKMTSFQLLDLQLKKTKPWMENDLTEISESVAADWAVFPPWDSLATMIKGALLLDWCIWAWWLVSGTAGSSVKWWSLFSALFSKLAGISP